MYRFAFTALLALIATCLMASPLDGADVPQTPLDGRSLPQFVDPLPNLDVIVAGPERITLHMREFRTSPLPSGFGGVDGSYAGTWAWGYLPEGSVGRDTYLGPVLVATRGLPTEIAWVNELGTTAESRVLAYTQSTDQTLHWADPAHGGADRCAESVEPATPPVGECAEHYDGAIPAVVHLHGGEVPAALDGGPDAWFTSDGTARGHAYYSHDPSLANGAVYRYPNVQEAAATWFHDHTLGATRLNVYAGLAGAYIVRDPPNERDDLPPPTALVIQDRMFDVDGQLYFPAGVPFVPNPEHPFWVPEFLGDVILVNGESWPYLEVERRRQRFLIVNGSNARTYALSLVNQGTGNAGPAIWQIGTDGGYLDRPAPIGGRNAGGLEHLVLMPGERADVIVDFSHQHRGAKLVLRNIARSPYPAGETVHGRTTGRVMQFRVVGGDVVDRSYDPASGEPLRRPMVRLADPVTGTVADGVDVHVVRQLTLNEVLGDPTEFAAIAYEGGPLEVLVNNTDYPGMSIRPYGDFVPITAGGVTSYYTELPHEGATEVWEVVNLTADAHPIHLHLAQFQLLNRERFDVPKYMAAYAAAFPGGMDPIGGTTYAPGTYVPGYGPPLDYRADRNPLGGGKDGGNPDVTPFLRGQPTPPPPNEAGWKDTVRMMPGEVTRIVVRWAPTDLPADTPMAQATYPFNPDGGHGYVWHCHIIDHEDNEMMRPTSIVANPAAARSYVPGLDY